MPKKPAAANSPPTFLRLNVKVVVVAVAVAAALAGGIAAASTTARHAGTLAPSADLATAPASFVGITPVRVLDTREPIGVPAAGPIPPDTTINVGVAGLYGIPANATSVAANVTIADATAVNYLTVWPTGQPRPTSAVNNGTPGFVFPSAGVFELGDGGQLSVYNSSGNTNVIIDVSGYFVPAAPAESGLASVFVDRGSGPVRFATLSVALGALAGTTTSSVFRFSCSAAQAPCKISYGAAVISDQPGNTVVHPRLLIDKEDGPGPGEPVTFCESADGANNNAGLAQIQRVPTLVDAEAAMDTPLSMGIGGTLDCGTAQPYGTGTVTEIWVPAASNGTSTAYYDVSATFAFSPGFELPPGP